MNNNINNIKLGSKISYKILGTINHKKKELYKVNLVRENCSYSKNSDFGFLQKIKLLSANLPPLIKRESKNNQFPQPPRR